MASAMAAAKARLLDAVKSIPELHTEVECAELARQLAKSQALLAQQAAETLDRMERIRQIVDEKTEG